ncbi:MAG: hypothetical protein WBQ43_20935 [Terriglobales bacterium]|jgi:hypothetical protein
MEKNFDSEPAENVTREELTSVMTALEPDQIIFAKEHHHCPRRELTRTEMILFWALRIYLVFMVGVVVYQIWTGAR